MQTLLKYLLVGGYIYCAVGLFVVLLMVIPVLRQFLAKIPGFFGLFLVLGGLVTLALSIIIWDGKLWIGATKYIENSLLLATLPLGTVFFSVGWLIAKTPNGWSGILGVSGGLISLIALIVILLPTFQMVTSLNKFEAEMKRALGDNYYALIPESLKSKMLSNPYNFTLNWDNSSTDTRNVVVVDDVAYRNTGNKFHNLIVYHPPLKNIGESKLPTILVIHGGGFGSGTRYDVSDFNYYMAKRNWVVFSMDYRLAPEFPFPSAQEDIQCALAFIAKEGSKFGADVSRLGAIGRSAGGTLALYAAYNADPLAGAGDCAKDLPKIRSVVALYPPTDLAEWFNKDRSGHAYDIVTNYIGGTPEQKPEQYKAASPISYVDRQLPPTLLFEPGRDQFDLGVQTGLLAQKLKSTTNKVVHIEFPWAGHTFDDVFNGISAQPSLYYIERFLAFTLSN
jgi:acetyl esterase/lipase